MRTLPVFLCLFLETWPAFHADCEQSLFFFRFSKGSARAWETRETRAALAPSVTRVVICVSRAFCPTDQEKRETACSLHFTWLSKPREAQAICGAKAVPSVLSYFKTLSTGPVPGIEPTARPTALHSSALPTEVILPRLTCDNRHTSVQIIS